MSADNVSTCPRCREKTLLEWHEVYRPHGAYNLELNESEPLLDAVAFDYQCRCYRCEFRDRFEHVHQYPTGGAV